MGVGVVLWIHGRSRRCPEGSSLSGCSAASAFTVRLPSPFLTADGGRYHLRCYIYQARDLIAMDKDSFSGERGG